MTDMHESTIEWDEMSDEERNDLLVEESSPNLPVDFSNNGSKRRFFPSTRPGDAMLLLPTSWVWELRCERGGISVCIESISPNRGEMSHVVVDPGRCGTRQIAVATALCLATLQAHGLKVKSRTLLYTEEPYFGP